MATKLSIRERLTNPNLREGLLDSIFNSIKAGKIKAKKDEVRQLMIAQYGSWAKVPDYQKEMFGMS